MISCRGEPGEIGMIWVFTTGENKFTHERLKRDTLFPMVQTVEELREVLLIPLDAFVLYMVNPT